jgi:PIN domain nuclease of toxin-antitoxin system
MLKNNLFLLDTHAFLWLVNGDDRIKKMTEFNALIRASEVSGLRISAISIWEIAMLEAKGRIRFSLDVSDWVEQALLLPGLILVPLLLHVAVTSTRLPGKFHGDPADRIIVATARYLQCPLVTADKKNPSVYPAQDMSK